MIDRSPAGRLLGPAGLVIAGLGLLLPFGAVSCAAEGSPGGSASLTYTGADLIGNDGGAFYAPPGLPPEAIKDLPPSVGSPLLHEVDVTRTRILLIVTVALLAVGVFAVLIRPRLVRATVLAAVAVPASILLIAAQLSARYAALRFFANHREFFPRSEADQALPDGVDIRLGAGFWLSLAFLVVVGVGGVVVIFRNTRRPSQPDAAVLALLTGEHTET